MGVEKCFGGLAGGTDGKYLKDDFTWDTPAGGVTSANVQAQTYTYFSDTGAADAYVITPSPAISAYAAGQRFVFLASAANTGASTLNVNAKGAKDIKKQHDTALAANDIEAGSIVDCIYDGTNFQMVSQIANAASGGGSVLYSVAYAAGESGTFTAPVGVYIVYLTGAPGGAGGGGNAYAGDGAPGGGGGAGACVKRFPYRVIPEAGYSYSVGSKGTGGAGGSNGTAGGNTVFGDLTLYGGSPGGTAGTGGAGGAFGNVSGKSGVAKNTTGNNSYTEGNSTEYEVGASGSGGSTGSAIKGGSSSVYSGGAVSANYSGGGGASLFGAGGVGAASAANGNNGTGYGSGGSGGGGGYSAKTGGNGTDGFLIVEYWVATAP